MTIIFWKVKKNQLKSEEKDFFLPVVCIFKKAMNKKYEARVKKTWEKEKTESKKKRRPTKKTGNRLPFKVFVLQKNHFEGNKVKIIIFQKHTNTRNTFNLRVS